MSAAARPARHPVKVRQSLATRWRSERLPTIWTLARRDLRSSLAGPGFYVVLALTVWAVSYFGVRPSLFQVGEYGILVLSGPLNRAFLLAAGFTAAYLGLSSALTIARERDRGTMEVLFYGPVDATCYVLAKHFQHMVLFLAALAFCGAAFSALGRLTNLGTGTGSGALWLGALLLGSATIAWSILLATMTRRVVLAIATYLGTTAFFTGFWLAHLVVMNLPGRELTVLLASVRLALDALQRFVMVWFSPLSYFERATAAAHAGEPARCWLILLAFGAYTAALLLSAIGFLDKKGVRP